MRVLFEIDKENYVKDGTIERRPSVRGIIIKDSKIAMMHSLLYEYYKLPGGGIEPNETYEEALVREVKEESGLTVKQETIKEYGYVQRIEKGNIEDIFIQDNYYFICGVEDHIDKQNLDDYEEYEMFQLEFVYPEYAIHINKSSDHKEKKNDQRFSSMIERENRLLQIITNEIL